MTNNIKKLLGGAIALAGAFMALNTKEEKKPESKPATEGDSSSTTGGEEVKSETNEPETETNEN